MQPYISLQIRNHIPHIVFYPDEGMSRSLTVDDESILPIVASIAKRLELIAEEEEVNAETLTNLFELARTSDESYLDTTPDLETEESEFKLAAIMNRLVDQALATREDQYPETELNDDVRAELASNLNADIFASLLDALYTVLIAKTLLAASELGIGKISLDDEHNNVRLLEKMSKELAKLGIELETAYKN